MLRADINNPERWRGLAEKSGYQANVLRKELQVSRRQLERYTHSLFGLSPQRWLCEQRLIVAGEMLIKQHCVKSVAFELGFKWVSHFSREFKSHYGRSPRAFLIRSRQASQADQKPRAADGLSGGAQLPLCFE